MGLRTASVRRPHADVMAPALTDSVQGQKFEGVPPKSHLEPASPVNSFETNKYPKTIVTKCSDPASPLNTDDLSTNLDSLSSVGYSSKDNQLDSFLTEFNSASDKTLPGTIMNLGSTSMGDQGDKMGLPKTLLNVNRIRNSSDADQLFGNNLEDDIMQQVIKSIEGSDQLNTSSSDLTEVFDMNIEKELLEQVDNMMNISMDDQPDELETAQKIKETQAGALLSDLQTKHYRVERRLDFLRRRCYKLQARLMGQHISGEVVGVFEQVHRLIKKPKDPAESIRAFGTSFGDSASTPLTSSSAKALTRKLETAKVLQANTAARQRNVPKYFGSGSIEASLFRNSTSGQVNIPQWSNLHKEELRKVSDQLRSQLQIVQEELDSEATESSSGGESCDESQSYNNPHQQFLSIQKRALWKYSVDRAAIAARWTWVQSQISDLEYRIRQHADLYQQVRSSKSPVRLENVALKPQPVLSQSEIAGHHDYGASPLDSTNASTALNGYLGQLPGAQAGKGQENESCARTRPLGSFTKRRLLQVAGLYAVSKKAARPSTVRCSCVASKTVCALCTFRTDPTHPRDSPDTLSKAEKVALLDPGFHPVLSSFEDTSQTLHLEAVMKMNEWQQRSLKMKTMKVLQKPDRSESARPYEHRSQKLEHRKKYNRLKPSTVSALSEKIKKKLRGRKVGRPPKYNKRPSQDFDAIGSDDAEVEATMGRGRHIAQLQAGPASYHSPGGSPLLQMQSISGFKQNSRSSRVGSYDIDNIVIPYSVAATTRVEKLQYKEILTPKWRLAEDEMVTIKIEKNNGSVSALNEDSDTEDVTEEAVQARHDRSELEEKKRFLSYMKFPPGYGRQRSHKRHDSLAESSGANTPDPASPRHDGSKSAGPEPLLMGSPPATPGTEEPLPSIAVVRRRTVSQSRFRDIKEEGVPHIDYVEQPPYDARTFPLADPDFESMVREMPEANREVKTNYRAQDTGIDNDFHVKNELQDSADSESTESAVGFNLNAGEDAMMDDYEENLMEEEDEDDEEDPNDPEWTDAEKSNYRDRHHRR
ncbi:KAT8 regulatory NSL complex subunit 1 isoform X1 [Euwallacea fornicatus]|uniref:KAT8 regulatory NSL complex subunit 1 isoform X1 n=1 Tax=Euwallacea fornicatus TaxID=995702 RepID=UPI00338DC331